MCNCKSKISGRKRRKTAIPYHTLGGVIIGGGSAKVINLITDKIGFLNDNPNLTPIIKVIAGGAGFMFSNNKFLQGISLGVLGVGGQELLGNQVQGILDLMPSGDSSAVQGVYRLERKRTNHLRAELARLKENKPTSNAVYTPPMATTL